ncbi:hypothetical protein RFI_03123 [Reticulomyxa filosa]|uniref:DOMON domain-containing protein n=1 Tax=Reticulomyxa filosa TaxID=46433 RepID=X6P632_RETFI|nr:hypothetical protein RFI_03123 [Reticulomyxa filosa]|eukprot:ETO33975.1 hypothetical protein RFI_03123 [Reticulomyxa filosa]
MTKADGACYTTGTQGDLTENLYDYYFNGYDSSNCVLDSKQDWNVLSNTVANSLRTIEAWRALDTGFFFYKYISFTLFLFIIFFFFGTNKKKKKIIIIIRICDTSGDFVLNYGDTTLPMIWAKSQSASLQLSDHGSSSTQRGAVNLQWSVVTGNKTTLLTSSPTPPSISPTKSPTPVPAPPSNATEKSFRVTDIVKGTLSLGLYMNRTHVTFEVYGPLDSWFAIGWGGHFTGDALIYTTGPFFVYSFVCLFI